MTTFIEKNGEALDEFDKKASQYGDHSVHTTVTVENGPTESELTIPAEQTKLDTVRRVSTGIVQSASDVLGYSMGSVKRAASGLGAGITRASQNVADKIQKSPKFPKAVRKRAEVDELSANILSSSSESDDDDGFGGGGRGDGAKLMAGRKSAKEVAARKKRKEQMKKEEMKSW